jgi:hypothetical protein
MPFVTGATGIADGEPGIADDGGNEKRIGGETFHENS